MAVGRPRSESYPICRQKRCDCLMNKNGRCMALEDTQFNKRCPFYISLKMAMDKYPDYILEEIYDRYGKRK